jgi:hypothetical protein
LARGLFKPNGHFFKLLTLSDNISISPVPSFPGLNTIGRSGREGAEPPFLFFFHFLSSDKDFFPSFFSFSTLSSNANNVKTPSFLSFLFLLTKKSVKTIEWIALNPKIKIAMRSFPGIGHEIIKSSTTEQRRKQTGARYDHSRIRKK